MSGIFMFMRDYFPAPRKRYSLSVGYQQKSVARARWNGNFCKVRGRLEQQYCIKVCDKITNTKANPIQIFQQAFVGDAMSTSQKEKLYNCFKDGRTSVDSEPRPSRPLKSLNVSVIGEVLTSVIQDIVSQSENLRTRWG